MIFDRGDQNLGRARRAWMLGSTSNERDRPSLMLPRLQAVAEVMEVFGWRGARPPDFKRGPRMMPWRWLMLFCAAFELPLLIHLLNLLGFAG